MSTMNEVSTMFFGVFFFVTTLPTSLSFPLTCALSQPSFLLSSPTFCLTLSDILLNFFYSPSLSLSVFQSASVTTHSLRDACAHTHTLTHSHTSTLSQTLCVSLTLTHSFSLTHIHLHSLTHTHTHILSLSHHTLTFSHTHSLSLSLKHTYTRTRSRSEGHTCVKMWTLT